MQLTSVDVNHSVKQGLSLPVMESFSTIQGEGYNTGKPAWFVRLAGCDVGCHWCDVKESWEIEGSPIVPIEDIENATRNNESQNVVITGGEPLIYNLQPLTELLAKSGKKLWLETSGAHTFSGVWHWVCFSPKKFAVPKKEIYSVADELKVIVFNHSDFEWAENHAAKVREKCKLYLQPEWSKKDEMLPKIIDYVKSNPHWNISLQTHKYMNIP